jgi:hypothetical protein
VSATAPAAPTVVGTYAALRARLQVTAPASHLATAFARAYRTCRAERDEAAVPVELEDAGPGPSAVNDALVRAMTVVDEAAVRATTPEMLVLHASAVLVGDAPVLFTGPSGAGKTTVAAALTATGATYVGDEALGLAEGADALLAYPKPFKLERGARAALAALTGGDAWRAQDGCDEVIVPADVIGRVVAPAPLAPPVAVVEIAYRPGAGARTAALSRADVAELLAEQTFSFSRWGARGLDAVARLARTAPGLRMEFGGLGAAVDTIGRVLR